MVPWRGDIFEENADMSTLNISLPAAMKAFVETQVHSGLYSSASDYVRTLIRDDQQRCTAAAFEATLLAGDGEDACAGGMPALCAWLRTRLGHRRHAGHDASG
jgi:putative addiction module CopG family antidote